MKLFEKEYEKVLQELNLKLTKEKDETQRNNILSDILYITAYLYGSDSNFEFVKKSFEEKQKFLEYHQLKKIGKCKIGYFKTVRVDKDTMEKISDQFFNFEMLKLKSVYNKIKSYNGIGYETERDGNKAIFGATVYIKSLDKNYIKIYLNNKLSDYSTLVHEIGHAKANSVCKNINKKQKFIEVYPKFLELVFSDYIKANDMPKVSYNFKLEMLKKTKEFLDEINREIYGYVYRDSIRNKIDDYIFEYKYDVVKDTILAFKLYDMYLNNPYQILEKMEYFIANLQVMSEEELLAIFGLKNSVFEDNIVFYKLLEQLKAEKNEIYLSLNGIKLK